MCHSQSELFINMDLRQSMLVGRGKFYTIVDRGNGVSVSTSGNRVKDKKMGIIRLIIIPIKIQTPISLRNEYR